VPPPVARPLPRLLTATSVPPQLREWLSDRVDAVAAFAVHIDGFEAVRDVLGEAAGETMARVVLDRLVSWAGPDGRAGSLGGARFVATVAGVATPQAAAAQLQRLVAEPVELAGLVVSRSASVGIACAADRSVTVDVLVERAGRACDGVRASGGDGVALFDATTDAERIEQLRLDLELHEALTNGALRLHYQPEYDLQTGQVLAVEALLRWQHPRLGILPAGEFIDATEHTRTFTAVQRWVFAECCRQLASWRGTPLQSLLLRVNVSGVRLARSSTVDELLASMSDQGVAGDQICVEITEGRMPRDLGPLDLQVRRLKAAGLSVALDDIGTGESAPTQLRALSIDTIKLDRTFVAELRTDHRAAALVTALVGAARALGFQIVAEGVDGPDTAAALVALGCLRGQGDALAPAVPASELPPLVARAATATEDVSQIS
jgi:EAL domain-containing protein (putative c-di-GMP-specific phosphodiesterase class I)/GGDEF domain-containing protein